MRKLKVTTLLAVATITAAACAQSPGSPTPVTTAQSVPISSAAATLAPTGHNVTESVCDEAFIAHQLRVMALEKAYRNEVFATAGDENAVKEARASRIALLDEWVAANEKLAAQNIEPAVRAALEETRSYIQQINVRDRFFTTTLAEMRLKLAELKGKLGNACLRA